MMHVPIHAVIILSLTCTTTPTEPYYGTSFQLTILHTNDVRAKYEQTKSYGEVCQPEDDRNGNCMFGASRL